MKKLVSNSLAMSNHFTKRQSWICKSTSSLDMTIYTRCHKVEMLYCAMQQLNMIVQYMMYLYSKPPSFLISSMKNMVTDAHTHGQEMEKTFSMMLRETVNSCFVLFLCQFISFYVFLCFRAVPRRQREYRVSSKKNKTRDTVAVVLSKSMYNVEERIKSASAETFLSIQTYFGLMNASSSSN